MAFTFVSLMMASSVSDGSSMHLLFHCGFRLQLCCVFSRSCIQPIMCNAETKAMPCNALNGWSCNAATATYVAFAAVSPAYKAGNAIPYTPGKPPSGGALWCGLPSNPCSTNVDKLICSHELVHLMQHLKLHCAEVSCERLSEYLSLCIAGLTFCIQSRPQELPPLTPTHTEVKTKAALAKHAACLQMEVV